MSILDQSTPTRKWGLDSFRQTLRHRPKLTLTQRGSGFCALTLGVGFVALNSGNNLIYLVLGMMLSLILSSGVLSSINLHRVRVKRHPELRGYAGQPLLVHLRLVNRKSYWPSMGIGVEDPPVYDQRVSKQGVQMIEGQKTRSMYVFRLKGSAEEHLKYHVTIQGRGTYTLEGARIYTRFPFGFFEKSVGLRLQQKLLVFPRVDAELSPHLEQKLSNDQRDLSHSDQSVLNQTHGLRGSELENVISIEPHISGTPLKFIHWKSSARRGELMTRRGEQSSTHSFTLWINPHYHPDGTHPLLHENDYYADLIMTICDRMWRQNRPVLIYGLAQTERLISPNSDEMNQFMYEMISFSVTASEVIHTRIPTSCHIVSIAQGVQLIDSRISADREIHIPIMHGNMMKDHHLTPYPQASSEQVE